MEDVVEDLREGQGTPTGRTGASGSPRRSGPTEPSEPSGSQHGLKPLGRTRTMFIESWVWDGYHLGYTIHDKAVQISFEMEVIFVLLW